MGEPPPLALRPLEGVRVLELGQLVAGPLAGAMLAYFGADVVKVEPLEGDAVRGWRTLEEGTSLWWKSLARNKRCIAVDLHHKEGQEIVRRLAAGVDVVLENFRPGTLERWGLAPSDLRDLFPKLIVARVSGFGQSGPDRDRPGFAAVCEAAAGFRYVNAIPGEVPLRPNLSLGDSLGGLHALIGILLALRSRELTGAGQIVDVALTESIMNVLEGAPLDFDRQGVIREPSGTGISGVVPSNAYPAREGGHIVIGANTDRLFASLMNLIGRPDLASDPALAQNPGRVARAEEIDRAIGAFTSTRSTEELDRTLREHGIPASPIRDMAAVMRDPHTIARGVMEPIGLTPEKHLPAFAPKLETTPGRSDWEGPPLGAHTVEVLSERLGYDDARIGQLSRGGVIKTASVTG